jgi:hypothetical protein
MNLNHFVSPRPQPKTPSKPCTVCGGNIVWRRRLAADWDEVKYCSASCRRALVAESRTMRDEYRAVSFCFATESEAPVA